MPRGGGIKQEDNWPPLATPLAGKSLFEWATTESSVRRGRAP